MSRTFLISCVFFALLTAAYAGEIYTYTDKDGQTVITNEPIPEEYENKAKKIDSYKRDSPKETQGYEAERKAQVQRQEAETRQGQQINRKEQKTDKEELKCYTEQDTSRVSGGIVSPNGVPLGGVVLPGAIWYICKDKNGKIVSKERR
jgi:hypothetical protein